MNKRKIGEKKDNNLFRIAVSLTPDIAEGYCVGLTALNINSQAIQATNTRKLSGSVDIDACVKEKYAEEARWDYVIGFEANAIFVEVHSAETSEVNVVLAKLRWLRNWLKTQAPELEKIKSETNPPFVWIPSGRMNILPGSPQFMRLSQSGIKLLSILRLK